MKRVDRSNPRKNESGNVLFLILIAVALFAALSYAVTQSSRSGGGDASSEKNLVSSSELTEYPAGVRTSIMRLIVSGGLTPDELLFDPPSAFGTSITTANQKYSVFHSAGGGATYQVAPPELMAGTSINGSTLGTWHFNSLYQLPNVGTTSTSSDTSGNDIIAFLNGVSKAVCLKVDSTLGISSIPTSAQVVNTLNSDQVASANGAITSTFPASTAGTLITTTPTGALSGQPFGCFENTTPTPHQYVYYHTVVER